MNDTTIKCLFPNRHSDSDLEIQLLKLRMTHKSYVIGTSYQILVFPSWHRWLSTEEIRPKIHVTRGGWRHGVTRKLRLGCFIGGVTTNATFDISVSHALWRTLEGQIRVLGWGGIWNLPRTPAANIRKVSNLKEGAAFVWKDIWRQELGILLRNACLLRVQCWWKGPQTAQSWWDSEKFVSIL